MFKCTILYFNVLKLKAAMILVFYVANRPFEFNFFISIKPENFSNTDLPCSKIEPYPFLLCELRSNEYQE